MGDYVSNMRTNRWVFVICVSNRRNQNGPDTSASASVAALATLRDVSVSVNTTACNHHTYEIKIEKKTHFVHVLPYEFTVFFSIEFTVFCWCPPCEFTVYDMSKRACASCWAMKSLHLCNAKPCREGMRTIMFDDLCRKPKKMQFTTTQTEMGEGGGIVITTNFPPISLFEAIAINTSPSIMTSARCSHICSPWQMPDTACVRTARRASRFILLNWFFSFADFSFDVCDRVRKNWNKELVVNFASSLPLKYEHHLLDQTSNDRAWLVARCSACRHVFHPRERFLRCIHPSTPQSLDVYKNAFGFCDFLLTFNVDTEQECWCVHSDSDQKHNTHRSAAASCTRRCCSKSRISCVAHCIHTHDMSQTTSYLCITVYHIISYHIISRYTSLYQCHISHHTTHHNPHLTSQYPTPSHSKQNH